MSTGFNSAINSLGKLSSLWEAKTYREVCLVSKDDKLYILDDNISLPFVSSNFNTELLNGSWIEVGVDNEVRHFVSNVNFPLVGLNNILYVDETNNTISKWNGTTYDLLSESNLVTSVNTKIGDIVLDKTDIGLENVDNTSDTNKPISIAAQTELNLKEDKSNKGVADGYVPLNSSAKIDSSYLPSYVDDVLEFTDLASLPLVGEIGKIYITLNDNKCFRWSGSVYIEVSAGGSILNYVDVTYTQLTTLVTNSQLIKGQVYRLTDYQTTYTQPVTNISKISNVIEPLYITATDVNKLANECLSEVYSQDIVYYDLLDTTEGFTKGKIYRRIDTLRNNDIGTDWRHIKYDRNGTDYLMFDFNNETNYNNKIEYNLITDTVFGNNFNGNKIYGVFYVNTISDYFTDNHIDTGFTLNNIGYGFSNNKIGKGFSSNDIGYNFINNDVGAGFLLNTFGFICENNKIETNIISSVFASYTSNTIIHNNLSFVIKDIKATNLPNSLGDVTFSKKVTAKADGTLGMEDVVLEEEIIVVGGVLTRNKTVVLPLNTQVVPANFYSSQQISEVVLNNGLITIGQVAFQNNLLTTVTIPSSVTSIGISAFQYNLLTSVTIPNSVTSIGSSAFASNLLTTLIIPNSVTSIGQVAFQNNLLTTVTISNSVTSIGQSAFQYNQLTTVTIPNSVTSIDSRAFQYNQLTTVTIPNSVTSIDSGAFQYNQLTTLIIPNSVTIINNGAFSNNQLTTVTIPNSVTSIDSGAFQYNQLTTVTIPNSVTSIGSYAFSNNQLTTVTIPNSVTSIDSGAFQYNQLTAVNLPTNCTYIATLGSNNSFDNTVVVTGGIPI